MSEVYADRRVRLRDRCAAAGSSAALVSRPANVRYLAGGSPPGAVLLVGPEPDADVLLCPVAPGGGGGGGGGGGAGPAPPPRGGAGGGG
ncbi:aminopeptidase P family N-terminal domain-containing protein, partial [Streptomyces venezuelae]|uniref:aminopeptidase P family N-terminal domain-containing protein n=1 Tax=Streptomyces venezuelae TaxID=54571 RepID=UPI00278C7943